MKETPMLARRFIMLSALFVLLLPASPALSDVITVPNGSFESPTVPMAPPYASPNISDWQKAPVPAWWTAAGYTADQWTNSAGEFVNVPFAPIDNIDGNQVAFMFSVPGYSLFQDLTTPFQVGMSYHLTVGIQGGGYNMPLGCPMEIELYYRDANGDQVAVGAQEITNTNSTGVLSHLTDYTLDIPTVAAGDAWAGQNIGVELLQTGNSGGYWDIDNVRLSAVPEPGSLVLLAVGLGMFVARRWRSSNR
jgi:hypothetical protein